MKTIKAIDFYGSVKKLADALGVSSQCVYKWGDEVPKGRAYEINHLTNRKVKV